MNTHLPIRTSTPRVLGIQRPMRRTSRTARCTVAGLLGVCLGTAPLPIAAPVGSLDPDFHTGSGIAGSFVHTIALSTEGKILVGGNFARVQGAPRGHLAQLQPDGSLDLDFAGAANNEVLSAAYQPDGRVFVGGAFSRVNGTNCGRIARLNPDGSLDLSFAQGTGVNAEVRAIALQPDGRVLIGGPFTRYDGHPCNGLARLHGDGTFDTGFVTGTGVGGERFVDEIRVLADGRILVAGDFPSYNGVRRASIVRLNADGSLDPTFDPGTGAKPGDPILGLALQPDGRILIVGSFVGFNRAPRNNLARLNSDGSVDESFDPGTGTSGGPINGLLQTVALEPDGKILIAGWFDRVDGVPRSHLARLFPDGQVDTNWTVRVDAQVRAIRLQADDKILFGGDFQRVNTVPSPRVARLSASEALPARFHALQADPDGRICLGFIGDPTRQYLFQVSDDLATWMDWTNSPCTGGGLHLTDPYATGHARRFYRALLRP